MTGGPSDGYPFRFLALLTRRSTSPSLKVGLDSRVDEADVFCKTAACDTSTLILSRPPLTSLDPSRPLSTSLDLNYTRVAGDPINQSVHVKASMFKGVCVSLRDHAGPRCDADTGGVGAARPTWMFQRRRSTPSV